jgi:magnesium transporter
MLNAFSLHDGRLEQTRVEQIEQLGPDTLWIDLHNPTDEEREWVERVYGQTLPTPDEMEEIEASARFYEDQEGMHINSYFLHDFDDRPRNITVAFTLKQGRIFTFHEEDLLTFRIYRMRARRQPYLARDAMSILLGLFDVKVERLADVLEQLYAKLEELSDAVFGSDDQEQDMKQVLSELARSEDMNGKARLSLMDKQRLLSFLLRRGTLTAEQVQQSHEILNDIKSLIAHSTFLFEKVDFLMEVAMGIINIDQNKIIKIFSIAAVILLPPTLIASIYGMNFQFMPELNWQWGYPLALGLMVLSAIAPYWYFKRKGWL